MIKIKIENTGIAPTVLQLNMYSLPKSQPVWIIIIIATDTFIYKWD